MPVPLIIENAIMRLADALFARRPQSKPSVEKLKQCRIISHRGEHRHPEVKENSLPAFELAAQAGVWGIELDVRWTKDAVPVVSHDADLRRLYADDCLIAQTMYRDLMQRFSAIASLEEVVDRFGKELHLMIEIKEAVDAEGRKDQTLASLLRPLEPVTDYHLMALDPQILSPLRLTPRGAKVAIGYYLPDSFSPYVRRNRWGGLCGHYLTMRRAIVSRHQRHSQRVGTGFINSPHVLHREINRGVDWLFSDNAALLQSTVTHALANASTPPARATKPADS